MNIVRISIYKLGLNSIFDLGLLGKAVLLWFEFHHCYSPTVSCIGCFGVTDEACALYVSVI